MANTEGSPMTADTRRRIEEILAVKESTIIELQQENARLRDALGHALRCSMPDCEACKEIGATWQ